MTESHHLRPLGSLFRQGIIACLVFMAPVFAALYALTVPRGAWRSVLSLQVVAILVVLLASIAFFRAGVWVSAAGLRERGFFGRLSYVPIEKIGSVMTAMTFTGVGSEASPQLFVCDHEGRQLIRLRGQFWSHESMQVVIDTLPVPHRAIDDAMSRRELHTDYPGLLYWFERRPVVAALAFTLATLALGALVVLVLDLLGISL